MKWIQWLLAAQFLITFSGNFAFGNPGADPGMFRPDQGGSGLKTSVIHTQETGDTVRAHKAFQAGLSLIIDGDYGGALEGFEQAFVGYRIGHSWQRAYLAGVEAARCYLFLEKFEEGLGAVNKMLGYVRNAKRGEAERWYLRIYQAILEHKSGNRRTGFEYIKGLIKAPPESLSENHPWLADAWNLYGYLLDYSGDRSEGIKWLKKGYDGLFEALGALHPVSIAALARLANGYHNLDDFGQSIMLSQAVLRNSRQTYGEVHPQTLRAIQIAGHYYVNLNENEQAERYALMSLEMTRKIYGARSEQMAYSMNSLGNVYANLGDSAKTVDYYLKAIKIRQQYSGPNSVNEGLVYFNLGIHYFNCMDWKLTRKYWERALGILEPLNGPQDPDVVALYLYIGETYGEEENFDAALRYYEEATKRLAPGFRARNAGDNPDPAIVRDRVQWLPVLQEKGTILVRKYRLQSHNPADLEAALKTLQLSVQVVDSIRMALSGDESRQILGDRAYVSYEWTLKALLDQFKLTGDSTWLEEAFRVMERSKSGTLWEAIKASKASRFAGIPDSLIEGEKKLREQLGEKEQELFEYQDDTLIEDRTIRELKGEVFKLSTQLQKLVMKLERDYPDYYRLKYDVGVCEFKAIRAYLIQEKATLVEYLEGDSSLFIMVLSPAGNKLVEVDKPDDFADRLKAFRGFFEPEALVLRSRLEAYPGEAWYWYQVLVQPVEAFLPDQGGKLIVVPDGFLGYLPFEALLGAAPGPKPDFRTLPYLIRRLRISYANSSTLLLEGQSRAVASGPTKVMAFAPDFFPFKVDSNDAKADRYRGSLTELKHTRAEIEAIGKALNTDLFIGREASELAFKEKGAAYPILHFATHGLVEDEEPLFSRIAFSSPENEGEDGYLHTYELFNMQLNARLAVLSACNTGSGMAIRGEGIMSLARGFMYAGCPSIVVSLWSVDDESASGIMAGFYRFLAQGMDKDEALRNAKLEYLAQASPVDAHPFYWAGFVQIGATEKLSNGESAGTESAGMLWLWLLVGTLGLIFLIREYR